MHTRTAFIVAVLGLPAVFTAGEARAQQATGFALNRFEPSERGSYWFTAESLDLRGSGRPALGAVFDYAHRPLAVYGADDAVKSTIVLRQVFAHVGGSYVIADRLRLSASLPVALNQKGNGGVSQGVTYPRPANSTSVGDLRLGGDVRVLGQYGDAATLAIGAQLWVPTGSRADYTGDENVRIGPRAALAGELGMFTYSGRLGLVYRALDEGFAGGALGSELTFGAAAGLLALDKKLVVGPELFGTTTVSDKSFEKRTTPLEGILGAHYQVADEWRIGGGVGAGLTRGFGSPVARGLLSIEWVPGYEPPKPPDQDGDGVPDEQDRCPTVAGVASADPSMNGCPPDKDKDGIADAVDACPDIVGVKSDDPKQNGCPPDEDKDGIYDAADACPTVAGIASEDPKQNGCPGDKDKDGIVDPSDACPDVPGIKTEDPKTNGCPDPDRDKDGVPNEQDACPDEPGKSNTDPAKNGCPDAIVKGDQITIMDQVQFATGSAKILPVSDPILQAVLKILNEHSEIKKLSVEGHTDNRGNAGANKKLSADRAAAVMAWLVKNGIAKERLSSAGFGQEKPLADNGTDEGRQKNRRVEFHIRNDADAPKGDAPKGDAPKSDKPKGDKPKADAPKADAPKADAPKADKPKADAPKADKPKADAPKADKPKADKPKADKPKADAPKADKPKADKPKADKPKAP